MNMSQHRDEAYAYRVIHDFFDTFGFAGAVQHTEKLIRKAESGGYWKLETPYNAVFLGQKLQELTGAVFVINRHFTERRKAIVAGEIPDVAATAHYMNGQRSSNAWNSFPRNLTARQYGNPYIAVKKFCAYATEAQWRQVVEELVEYGLSKTLLHETCRYNVFTVRLKLLQVVEACHLIDVRMGGKKV